MYQPTLGRFLSRDPLSENGVEILTDTGFYADRLAAMSANPWYYGGNRENPWVYANNPATGQSYGQHSLVRGSPTIPDLHPYVYVGNNPIRRTDPRGLSSAALPYACITFPGSGVCAVCAGTCACNAPGILYAILLVAMAPVSDACCLSSCRPPAANQPAAMFACMQNVLRGAFGPRVICTCT
jgi:hypothetical protein